MRKYALILVLLFLAACQSPATREPTEAAAGADSGHFAAIVRDIAAQRSQKDNAFAMGASSPFRDLPGDFKGLAYFPVNAAWRKTARWDKDTAGTAARITDTRGKIRDYVPAGRLLFKHDGREYSLPVYYENLEKNILFVMFRDLTNGQETYGGGRYLEFRIPDTGAGSVILDFNQAYNPWCHYNHDYACPLVPASHKLDVKIEAGEKKYPGAD